MLVLWTDKLWLEGIDWKDDVSDTMKSNWHSYLKRLKGIENIAIPRWLGSFKECPVELHGFCDASTSAFAAAVYIKILNDNGEGVVNLLQSKTKVAPLKVLSIPKLELCGATLLTKLMHKVHDMLDLNITNVYYWTDSITVLCWLRGESSRWNVFVGNRVGEVQRHSNISQWRYISTHDNPADCAARNLAEKVQRKCITCFKYKAKYLQQIMAIFRL